MSDLVSALSVAAIALLPVGATMYVGYRYGYRQRIGIAGLVWRALLLSVALSWSLVGGSSHDAGWGLILPNVLIAAFFGVASAQGYEVLPPLWLAPLAHLFAYALSVRYGYNSAEREYTKLPPA
ncbi:hypothetical protein J5226_12220 [Lysobacter sp. K5869]|uniref:hypothetical protein n=1 Tax=Lysobacter sp. K5869 TaxID=2820808 RepID=UPI001C06000F|nr:hypothetical protein [Lysobacter sp. K5869]QWP79097.1 hypothetical protein J5226_12220 [Lysobacter sp. K5869]